MDDKIPDVVKQEMDKQDARADLAEARQTAHDLRSTVQDERMTQQDRTMKAWLVKITIVAAIMGILGTSVSWASGWWGIPARVNKLEVRDAEVHDAILEIKASLANIKDRQTEMQIDMKGLKK